MTLGDVGTYYYYYYYYYYYLPLLDCHTWALPP